MRSPEMILCYLGIEMYSEDDMLEFIFEADLLSFGSLKNALLFFSTFCASNEFYAILI